MLPIIPIDSQLNVLSRDFGRSRCISLSCLKVDGVVEGVESTTDSDLPSTSLVLLAEAMSTDIDAADL